MTNSARLLHLFIWLMVLSASVLPASAATERAKPETVLGDFDGDGVVDVVAALDTKGLLCRGPTLDACLPLSLPKHAYLYAHHSDVGGVSKLVSIPRAGDPEICDLERNSGRLSCSPITAEVGMAVSERQKEAAVRKVVVFEATAGTVACTSIDGELVTCTSAASSQTASFGRRYTAGQFTTIDASQVLVNDIATSTLCTIAVDGVSGCVPVAHATEVISSDVLTPAAILNSGFHALVALTTTSVSLCKIVQTTGSAASTVCARAWTGEMPPTVQLSVRQSSSRPGADNLVVTVDHAQASDNMQERRIQMFAGQLNRASKLLREIGSLGAMAAAARPTPKILEEDDGAPLIVEVVGWPEASSPVYDWPDPAPWFDPGWPVQFNFEMNRVQNPACVAACERAWEAGNAVCRRVRSPVAKTLCWAANNSAFGACLATC